MQHSAYSESRKPHIRTKFQCLWGYHEVNWWLRWWGRLGSQLREMKALQGLSDTQGRPRGELGTKYGSPRQNPNQCKQNRPLVKGRSPVGCTCQPRATVNDQMAVEKIVRWRLPSQQCDCSKGRSLQQPLPPLRWPQHCSSDQKQILSPGSKLSSGPHLTSVTKC